jgi:two-component system, chemotaxis family, response regulator Rcp1
MKNNGKLRNTPPPSADPEAIEILLVEDTESDARRTMDALRDGKVRNRVVWVQDGEQALDLLHRAGSFTRASRPDLILLDWYLPKVNGWDVLAHIKEDPELKRIPVVIMTTSDQERDVLKAYNLHANCFVNKPVDVREFINVVRSIEDFWLTVVKLPAA